MFRSRVLNYADTTRAESCIRYADKQASVLGLEVDLKNLLVSVSILDTYDHAIGTIGLKLKVRHVNWRSLSRIV